MEIWEKKNQKFENKIQILEIFWKFGKTLEIWESFENKEIWK